MYTWENNVMNTVGVKFPDHTTGLGQIGRAHV